MTDRLICQDCSFANPAGARFCAGCGKKLEQLCPSCGIAVVETWRFCNSCGTPLQPALESSTSAPAAPPPAAAIEPRTPIAAERRQVTALFSDMVGSTVLSQQLELEEYRAIILAFQQLVIAEVERFDGFVAQFLGDGLIAYFGYPQAHEDAPERAVRAALAIASKVPSLRTPAGKPLATRTAVATGQAIVGDVALHGDTATGEAPILASRLQALAKPGSVVISASTGNLIRGLFVTRDLGTHELKGIADAVRVWQVIGESRAESRFDAAHDLGLRPLIGRRHENALLMERWNLAKGGEGQVALLTGEPGIGKSRLLKALQDGIAADPHPVVHRRLRFQCSPQHANSALYPFIRHLELACGFELSDTPAQKTDKLEALLGRSFDDLTAVMPLYAALLSLPDSDRYPPLELSPKQQMERTQQLLCDQLSAQAASEPVLVFFEDAHWIDPTSSGLLDAMIDRARSLRLMMVITFRLGFQPTWIGQPHVTLHSLNRLGRQECRDMIRAFSPDRNLPADLVDQIISKSDGVPLFLEELTKTILDLRLLEDDGKSLNLRAPLSELAIPTSLQDSLMARLDRSPLAKEIIQIASVLGREFSDELLGQLAELDTVPLTAALETLVEDGLLVRRSSSIAGRYAFRHALVLDAAYQSMLKSTRISLHHRIVDTLEARGGDVEVLPQILAYHCTAAKLVEKAVAYWLQAAKRDIARSALQEARNSLTSGLKVLYTASDGHDYRVREVELLTKLGFMHRTLQGPSHPDTEKAFARALELCQELAGTIDSFPATVGLYTCNWSKANFDRALALAEKISDLAATENGADAERRFVAHCARGMVAWHAGKNDLAERDLTAAAALESAVTNSALAATYGTDFRVLADRYRAMTAFSLGDPEATRRGAHDIVEAGRKSPVAVSRILGLASGVHIAILLRDHDDLIEWADECIPLAAEFGFPTWHQFCALSRGWSRANMGQPKDGLEEMLEAIGHWRENGNPVWRPLVRNMTAEVYLMLDQPTIALELTDKQIDEIGRTGGYQFASLTMMTRGRALLALDRADEAEAHFHKAIAYAAEQNAKTWELRATAHLVELHRSRGQPDDASALLQPFESVFAAGDIENMVREVSRH